MIPTDSVIRTISNKLKNSPKIYKAAKNTYKQIYQKFLRIRGSFYSIHPNVLLHQVLENSNHFFGYYDKSPWSTDGQRIIFHRHLHGKMIQIIVYDIHTKVLKLLDESPSWTWQQGAMLQWWPNLENCCVYNTIIENKLMAVIRDCITGKIIGQLPMPIQTIHPSGEYYLSLNFRRLYKLREDYGYSSDVSNFSPFQNHNEDGLWRIDLHNKSVDLIISLDDLINKNNTSSMNLAEHKVNHVIYSPNGQRIAFLHRWFKKNKKIDRLYTADNNGNKLFLLVDDEMTSHYSWKDNSWILAYCRRESSGNGYYLLRDLSDEFESFEFGVLNVHGDGHPSFSPDKRWIITDTYPDFNLMQNLILFDTVKREKFILGRFFSPLNFNGINRCDLHPRWSPDGKYIAIDSAHSGNRSLFIIDITAIVTK
jgi:Tol biopolymer transport system component